jgi:CubicO group peptidase (beta-lactamase class C family)
MHKLITITTVLLLILSCSQQRTQSSIEQSIYRIENGLIEQRIFDFKAGVIKFELLDRIFQPDSAQFASSKTLAERMEHYKTPGVSIAVVNKYQIEWARAYGIMDVNTGAPVTTETIFEAASTSKLITAVMALHFVQKGLIELDTNVNTYLKSWQVPENEFTAKEKITLRRLLTHQAGLPSTNYGHDENIGYPTLIDVLNGKSPALNKPATPEFNPGSRWQYSNVAYNVIQLLLEDVSGKSFQQIAEEIIFNPLEMKSCTFIYPLDPERKKLEAMPHDAEGISRRPGMHLTALAHGGLTTTPGDLAKFINELMLSYHGKSEKVLSQAMTRQLFTKECEIDQKIMPLPFDEGLGVFLMGEGKDLLFTHPGNNYPGLNCWLIGWPERGTGAVIMSNAANFGLLSVEIICAINNEYNQL